MDSRLPRAGLAGVIFTAAAVALGHAVFGRFPATGRAPALLVPALLTTTLLAASDHRTAGRLGRGALAVPIAVLMALLMLATVDRLAGVWTGMAIESLAYQAAALAIACLSVIYGWRYRVGGGYLLAAIAVSWLTALAIVAWTMAVIDGATLARHTGKAALVLTATGLAGWVVGYGLKERQCARAAVPDRLAARASLPRDP